MCDRDQADHRTRGQLTITSNKSMMVIAAAADNDDDDDDGDDDAYARAADVRQT